MSDLLLQRARETFGRDRFATEVTGIEIVDVAVDYAKCELQITDCHRNAMGAVMGGVIFTLADFCFAVASNAEKLSVVSVSSNIVYLNAVRGQRLIAEAHCTKSGRRNCFFRVCITDELGTAVAEVSEVGCNLE
ncbi:MAG: PaaI family thioesterase [Bacteroidales bacterium]|jgi:acyl-CoA thioesterase|nr:PaaI family thioesterase [Bacteroidales bacterium]